MPSNILDSRFFQQPGFTELYDLWLGIFSEGSNEFDAAVTLKQMHTVRDDLVADGIQSTAAIDVLEGIACRYARITLSAIAAVEVDFMYA